MTANFTTGQPEPQNRQAKTQCAVIICLKRKVVSVVDRLTSVLEQQVEDAARVTVQSYGIMQKQFDGYLVVTCRSGFPAAFLALLHSDDGVEEFVVFDLIERQQQRPETTSEEGGARS
ncbi:hypothetical protein [Dictyobacter formicarum]|uniref:Uncharacterized protein n=1 Tax=Dictyobacter formicarum TaxID=2778368 RepID=A0ABQ3VR97_9CHLR|nr:hypothetical protein [Dictyobacter formicarum]GHO88234.1 hypothetical protein KSZ_62400 [Dictyobacter formicarum]